MAIYRNVQISYWQDAFVLDLTPEEKFFYLYLLTNSKTSQCGIYELPMKVCEIETGYNRETVTKLLNKFIEYGKIKYCKETKEVYIVNWIKYNPINNINIKKRVLSELKEVKCCEFASAYVGATKGLARGYEGASSEYAPEEANNAAEDTKNGMDEAINEDLPAEICEDEDAQGDDSGRESGENYRGYEGATKGLPRGYQAPCKKEEQEQEETPEEEQEETIADAPAESEAESVDNFEDQEDAGQGPEAAPYQKIKEEWNRICTGYPPVKQITRKRKVHIKARWAQFQNNMDAFTNAFNKLQESLFCKGVNERAWVASFDWIIENDTNMVKVLEDKYKNRPGPQVKPTGKMNAFHNYKERELPYTEAELNEILKNKNRQAG